MRSSDRRISVARFFEEEAPTTKDTIPVPPPSDSHPGPLERAMDHSMDTIPTPPPESGVVENIVIPPLKPIDEP